MRCRNRAHAARLLAEHLTVYHGKNPLVLAIPRGAGVPMGQIIAETLGGELDVVLVHKLGAPGNPELAIGAVDETVGVYLSEFPIRLMADGGLKQRADLSRRTSVYQSAIRHPSNQA